MILTVSDVVEVKNEGQSDVEDLVKTLRKQAKMKLKKKSKKSSKKKFDKSLVKSGIYDLISLVKKAFFDLFHSSMGDYRWIKSKKVKRSFSLVK